MMASKQEKPRVRFAPSPTGFVHIGSVRTALFNWLFARHRDGTFILRIEDTDRERSKPEYEAELLEALRWFGLDWDEGPYRQSERTEIYARYLDRLLASGHAYYCYCTKEELDGQRQSMESAGLPPKYSGHCRTLKAPPDGRTPQVIRFKIPEAKVKFHDLVRGAVQFDAALFGDIVIAKDRTTPLYNFAAVVDDFEMKITHVIRGEEHLSNTPKQILLAQALKLPEIAYAHIPLILNADRSKLSKRTNEVSLLDYRRAGYLPDALLNFVALLGWHPAGNEEILSRAALITQFDLTRAQKSGAVFNIEKLKWMNAQYIKTAPAEALYPHLAPILHAHGISAEQPFVLRVIEAERERIKTLTDIPNMSAFFFYLADYDPALLNWKTIPAPATKEALSAIRGTLDGIAEGDWGRDAIASALAPLIAGSDRGSVLWPLRIALSGEKASPDPLVIAEVLGKGESLRRLSVALNKIGLAL